MFKFLANLIGKNSWFTPKSTIIDQMNEKRPLPVGMNEFDVWSDRIVSGTMLSADVESQKFALATMLINLKPTEDHECDAYFIKALRKAAVNQIAGAQMEKIRDAAKARLQAEQQAKLAEATANQQSTQLAEVTPIKASNDGSQPTN